MEPNMNNGTPSSHPGVPIAWAVAAIVVVAGVALLSGVQLARSNSDIACSRSASDQGACTGGSWSGWTTVSEGGGTAVEQRTYTGLRNTISGQFNYVTVQHAGCSPSAARNETGTITSSYSACQIQETRTRTIAAGTSAASTANNAPQSTIIGTTQSETTGDVATSTQISGNFRDYQNIVDDRLANSSIMAAPSIVRAGDISTISWTSSHVRSCTVTGTNGDSWPKTTTEIVYETQTDAEGNQVQVPVERTVTPAALTGSEKSKPITERTTYTLLCITSIGRQLTEQVTVTLLPTFQEL